VGAVSPVVDAAMGGDVAASLALADVDVGLLTGGADKPYAFGLATALAGRGVRLDVIGSDDVDHPGLHVRAGVRFLNLRGSQRTDAGIASKVWRVLVYYLRLIRYAATARPRILHILWNNKFPILDRTLLMLYYRLLGKKVVLTAHNVNAATRDGDDSWLNRSTLAMQYRLCDHIFVHTDAMKTELIREFGVQDDAVTVVPFGINNAVPNTTLTRRDARRRLGIPDGAKVILFFGWIWPYKGLELLVEAFQRIAEEDPRYRLVIAGKLKGGNEEYLADVQGAIERHWSRGRVIQRIDYIPDEETELYFKAADVFTLPYRRIYQSGVLFLGYSFGVPVVASDVGSLRDDIVEGVTGSLFRPGDPADLARALRAYFTSDLYLGLDQRRPGIAQYAAERHSWETVSQMTRVVYEDLLS
jgi:glycosyltransferase involved in cell wall biosynthesis